MKHFPMPASAFAAALNRPREAATKIGMTYLARLARIVPAAALVMIAACSSSSADGGGGGGGTGGTGDCKTGKNAPYATPAGTPFALPAGVTLQNDEITGDFAADCKEESSPIEYGGDLIIACMGFTNTTAAAITLKLPAGLFFLVKAPEGQHGLMLQDHELTLPAGQTSFFKINLFCANKHCVYGRRTDRYRFGNVTSDPKLRELVDLAKKVSLQFGDTDEADAFGQAIWDITDGDGVTAEHRALIAKLPPL